MKKLAILIFSLLALFTIASTAIAAKGPILNKVSLQLQSESWATTKTARVVIGINATLQDRALGQIHGQILNNLKKIAASQWHITQFNRSKSQSGLEQLYVQASTRVPENVLADVRAKAKAVSRPGANYNIVAIQFNPSFAEIEKVKAQLRQKIYADAKAELARLNTVYPNEKFYLHSVSFSDGALRPAPRILGLARVAKMATPLTVSNKIKLQATVVLASKLK